MNRSNNAPFGRSSGSAIQPGFGFALLTLVTVPLMTAALWTVA